VDAGPPQLAYAIDDLGRAVPVRGQVAALHDAVGPHLIEVGNHRFQRREVAMDVGNDGGSHVAAPAN
jgi:hypothetical protein